MSPVVNVPAGTEEDFILMDVFTGFSMRKAAWKMRKYGRQFPELAGKITSLDVATPHTYERYCGAYQGAWMSFANTPGGETLQHDGRIEGIDNLFMAGQWFMPPGGLPSAAVTGKWSIQRIVDQERK